MNLHPYQSKILKKLMYNPKLKFSDLQLQKLTSKHFNYHLKQLVDANFITKENNSYYLTNFGKDYVSKLDERNMELEKQPKLSVALIITRINGARKEFLVTKRLKQPYYGKVGGFTGKIRFGEAFEEAARREMLEETGLTGDFKMAHIHHKLAHTPEDPTQYIQDNLFVVFHVTNTEGVLTESNQEQENFWVEENELFQRDDLFNTFPEIVKYAQEADGKISEGVIEETGF